MHLGAYRFAMITFVVTHLICAVALPITISYDGHEYLNMAEVVFSSRFPAEWLPPVRTPGYPIALKMSFLLFGEQPGAVAVAGMLFGLVGGLMCGSILRKLSGPGWGAAGLIMLSFYPLLIVYEHHALTEVTTFFFLALLVFVLLNETLTGYPTLKAVALALAVSAGYYFRQTLLDMIPIVLILFVLEQTTRTPLVAKRLVTIGLQCLIIIGLPIVLKLPFDPYVKNADFQSATITQGIIRQMVIPENSAELGSAAALYSEAIEISGAKGNLYSGLRADYVGPIADIVNPIIGSGPTALPRLALKYPVRYLKGLLRTALLFAGIRGLESDNEPATAFVLTVGPLNIISEGRADLGAKTRKLFSAPTTDNIVKVMLRGLVPPYNSLVIVSMVTLFVGFVIGVVTRNLALITLSSIPLGYIAIHTIVLASIDRYAFPVYPIAMINLVYCVSLMAANIADVAWKVNITGVRVRISQMWNLGRQMSPKEGNAPTHR